MKHSRNDVIRVASAYVGARRGDSTHRMILDTYNEYKHSGWGVNTPWCAIYFSFVAIKLGYTDFPISASCGEIISQCLRKNWWIEQDNFMPAKGMGIIYAWDDGKNYANYDNTDGHDHIGWIVDVDYDKKKFMVVEGNKGDESVIGTRIMDFNGRYIRGFINPEYDEEKKPDVIDHPIYHIVKKGDNMTKIAKANGLTLNQLKALNPQITNVNKIVVGQKVRIK